MPIIIGSSYSPVYSVSSTLSPAAANRVHLALMNNSSSRIAVIAVSYNGILTATVTGYPLGIYLVRTNSISGGSTVSIVKLDSTYPDVQNIIAYITPTLNNTLGIIDVTAINVEDAGGITGMVKNYGNDSYKIIVNPDEGIALVQYGVSGVGLIGLTIFFEVI